MTVRGVYDEEVHPGVDQCLRAPLGVLAHADRRTDHERPPGSLVASGYSSLLAKSLTVMSPRSGPASSMSGSFSTLLRRSRSSA